MARSYQLLTPSLLRLQRVWTVSTSGLTIVMQSHLLLVKILIPFSHINTSTADRVADTEKAFCNHHEASEEVTLNVVRFLLSQVIHLRTSPPSLHIVVSLPGSPIWHRMWTTFPSGWNLTEAAIRECASDCRLLPGPAPGLASARAASPARAPSRAPSPTTVSPAVPTGLLLLCLRYCSCYLVLLPLLLLRWVLPPSVLLREQHGPTPFHRLRGARRARGIWCCLIQS